MANILSTRPHSHYSYLQDAGHTKVKKLLASLKGNDLFCDPDFPATNDSLYLNPSDELPSIDWKRPHQLVSKPQMFVDGASRCDVKQGAIGDCWFLAACSAIATRPELIKQVIPEGQVLHAEGYKGLVTFRFWRMGKWVTINIDDRLPVDEDDDLYYGKCSDPNEFWLPLIEKAFAKFHGNYKNLDGGALPESFQSLTGYISQSLIFLDEYPRNELFKYIRQEFKHGAVITCSRGDIETVGLVPGHAYTVTGARRMQLKGEKLARLLRVRNPWGQLEWKGAWADDDTHWDKVKSSIKEKMEYNLEDDGEFWIKMADFIKQFDGITIATKIPDQDDDEPLQVKNLYSLHNAWRKGRTAGGSKDEDIKKYSTNPQYLLKVKEPDDGDVCQIGEASDDEEVCSAIQTCSVIIELIQEHNRKKYKEFCSLGIAVYPYKKSKPYKRLTAGDLSEYEEVEGSTQWYMAISSAVVRLDLEPGCYVIIPSTEEADVYREFLLRVYCRKPIVVKELH